MNISFRRIPVLLALMLSACSLLEPSPIQRSSTLSSQQTFSTIKQQIEQGNLSDGLKQLQALMQAEPANIEYRAYWLSKRAAQINQWLQAADAARSKQAWGEAERLYSNVLEMEPNHAYASEGLRRIAVEQAHMQALSQAEEALHANQLEIASQSVQRVLSANPAHHAARQLYERIEQKRLANTMMPPSLRGRLKEKVTLEFKEIPVKSVFEFIAKAANVNFIYDQALSSDIKTSIFVKNTSVDEVIQLVLTTNQLEKKVLNDSTVLIYPQSRRNEYQELYARSFYLTNMEAKRAQNLIKTIVKTKDIVIDEKLNTLVMRDTPEAIVMAEKLIMSQDLSEPEVMMEVEILEVNRKRLEAIGIKYPTQATLGVRGLEAATSLGGSTFTPGKLSLAELKNFNANLGVFGITDPALALNFLNQDTDTNLLANPQIRVKNKEKAKILIGDKIPVITSTANSTGFVSENVTYLDVGIKLDVEPSILLNDEVSIKVGLEVSNQTDQIKSSSGTITYAIGTRNANTVLRLKNNETQVLAGLFRDDEQRVVNKVPGLGNLPLIGNLFTDNNKDKRKKEIVLLITPHIISNVTPPEARLTYFAAGKDADGSGKATRYTEPINVNTGSSTSLTKSPQELQADRAQLDKSFVDTLTQPSPNSNPSAATVPPTDSASTR